MWDRAKARALLEGLASAFNLSGDLAYPDIPETHQGTEEEKLQGDWARLCNDGQRVMQDFTSAVGKVFPHSK